MSQTSTSNENQIKKAKAQAKKDAGVEKTIIETLMATIAGRRWIWNQLAFAQIFVAGESLDPQVMAFEKGRRNTGLKLLDAVMRYAPAQFVKMLEESSSANLNEPTEEDNETIED